MSAIYIKKCLFINTTFLLQNIYLGLSIFFNCASTSLLTASTSLLTGGTFPFTFFWISYTALFEIRRYQYKWVKVPGIGPYWKVCIVGHGLMGVFFNFLLVFCNWSYLNSLIFPYQKEDLPWKLMLSFHLKYRGLHFFDRFVRYLQSLLTRQNTQPLSWHQDFLHLTPEIKFQVFNKLIKAKFWN